MSSLKKIFQTVPFPLSPSYFYDRIPEGFRISRQPGFLTSEGGLLFTKDAALDKYTSPVDQNAPIGKVAWDGQLMIPVWKFLPHRYTGVVTFLSLWLYTDLPQYITPTPGIAPIMIMYKFLDYLAPSGEDTSSTGTTTAEAMFNSHTWQWVFFGGHLIKILFIFLLFNSGLFNPISLNPFKEKKLRSSKPDVKLFERIGWTSVRKATPDEWRTENSGNKIKEIGIGAAHQAGLLSTLPHEGIFLEDGEGWAVPKTNNNNNKTDKEIIGKPGPRFYLSDDYLTKYYLPLATVFSDPEVNDEMRGEILSYYRKFGPKKGTPEIKQYYEMRVKANEKEEKEKEKDKEK